MLRIVSLATLVVISLRALGAEPIQESIPRDFFALLEKGKQDEAFLFLRWSSPDLFEDSTKVEQATKQFIVTTASLGKLHGCEKLGQRKLRNRYEVAQYLCLYERMPLRMQFDFYRPKDDWKLTGFRFEGKTDRLLEGQIDRDVAADSTSVRSAPSTK